MVWEIDDSKPEVEGLDAEGRPDPAYAAALGLLRAPFGRRVLAAACDGAIWLVLQLPLWIGAVPLLLKLAAGSVSAYGFLNHPGFMLSAVMAGVTVLLTLVFGIVQLFLHGLKGLTIGKAVAGIRSVNVRTLERPRVGAVFLRFLIVGLSGIVPLAGPVFLLISPTFDPERRGRGWHDKATGVWLVDVREGLNPFDEKRMRIARKMVKTEPAPERAALPSLATPIGPTAQPEYRPGSRVSAGVIGVARPHDSRERPTIGLSLATPAAGPGPSEAGKPVLGGYRVPERDRGGLSSTAAAPVPVPAPLPPPEPQPAPAPAPQPAPAPAPQSAPVPQPASAPQPAPAPQPVPDPQPAPSMRFELHFDTGDSIPVAEPVLLGRNPDAAGHAGARPVALADDSRSLSKTHMLVRPVDGGIEIVDCHSTNGSGLIRDGVTYAAAAGTPVMAVEGDMIRLGDRVAAVVRA